MKALYKPAGERMREIEVENELRALQNLVGGYIEVIRLTTDLVFIINEEGKNNGMLYNCDICDDMIFGSIIAVGVKDEEFCDVPCNLERMCRLFPQFKED